MEFRATDIYSGIEVENQFQIGAIIAAVDTSAFPSDNPKLSRYFRDLASEGWIVYPLNVNRIIELTEVKVMIQNAYANAPIKPRALVLIVRVPVPYSDDIFPDAHGTGSGNYNGAWAADMYYGDHDGIWTDNAVVLVEKFQSHPQMEKLERKAIPEVQRFVFVKPNVHYNILVKHSSTVCCLVP